jgi:eukaryotic-like serine/threonine-protein kinase
LDTSNPSIGRLRISRAAGSVGAGKYRVLGNLGHGGMADVQLGAAQGPQGFTKLVVIKRLRPLLADDPTVVSMFMDEARLAARVNHQNVVHTYEFGEERGSYFIVMEYLEGQSLHQLLQAVGAARRKVAPALWARIAADALAGLHYTHELRDYDGTPLHVVHRDVSPQNIVVTYEGQVKLVDFGIAKAALNNAKTESQVIKGKLAYMAPEQALPSSGVDIDRRADTFSMGIVLWECLTGKRLITGDARSALAKLVDLEFEPPSSLDPEVPPELDAIVLRALRRPVAERYQTAEEMREALEEWLRGKGDKGRVVGEKDLRGLIDGLFSAEREEAKRQILEHIPGLSSRAGLLGPQVAARASGPSFDGVGASVGPESPAGFSITESVNSLGAVRTDASRQPEPRRTLVARAMTPLALAAAVVFALLAARRGSSHPPSAPPSAAAATAAATESAPASRPSVVTTRVVVRALPADAVVSFDGAPTENPFVGTFERDDVEHRVRITAPGYAPVTKLVRLDQEAVSLDVTLDVALDKRTPPAAPFGASPRKAPPAQAGKRPVKSGQALDDDPWK